MRSENRRNQSRPDLRQRLSQNCRRLGENVERWTATRGQDGAKRYYLRITENDDPDDGAKIEINSSTRMADERLVIDAGFLELVRLGIKRADDQLIVESLVLVDQLIEVETLNGPG